MNTVERMRGELIAEGAHHVGRAWAVARVNALREERRATSGAWPATLTEARGQVDVTLRNWLVERGQSPISPHEREAAVRMVYATAKREWLTYREPEIDP